MARGRRSGKPLPTYKKAMIQVVAYRRIRSMVTTALKRFQLNTTQWMMLEVLYESATGLRITDIAHSLEVEVPLITRLSQSLLKEGLIENKQAVRDKRAKPLLLTARGMNLVKTVEQEIEKRTKRMEAGLSDKQLKQYFATLETFMDNAPPAGRTI